MHPLQVTGACTTVTVSARLQRESLEHGYRAAEVCGPSQPRKGARRASRSASSARRPTPIEGNTSREEDHLPDDAFAFPDVRKEPLVDAAHVRNAVARFDQVEGVSDADRDRAWRRIRSAARVFDVELHEHDWRGLFQGGKVHGAA